MTDIETAATDADSLVQRVLATVRTAQAEGFEPLELHLNHRDWTEAKAAFSAASAYAAKQAVREQARTICGVALEIEEAGAEGYLGDSEIIGWRSRTGDEKRFPVICQNGPVSP